MRTLIHFPLLLFAALSLLVAACGPTTDTESEATQGRKGQVEVKGFRYVQQRNGTREVMGELYNTSSKSIGRAQIQVSLFDANNVRIATMNVEVQDIPASGLVQFRKPITTEKDVQAARVRSVIIL